MVYTTATAIPTILCVACAVCVPLYALSAVLCTSCILYQDAGTYDAGIATAVVTQSGYCKDTYAVILLLLLHELLVVCTIPAASNGYVVTTTCR